jgi:hypothetical protein
MLNGDRKLRKGVTGIVHLPGEADDRTECYQGSAMGWVTWRRAKLDGLELCWFCKRILERRQRDECEEVVA